MKRRLWYCKRFKDKDQWVWIKFYLKEGANEVEGEEDEKEDDREEEEVEEKNEEEE